MKRISLAVFVLAFAAPAAVFAQDDPKSKADALFREGERLFTAGEIASACEKFAQSHVLDPALGTLINLGLCHEKQGRTATAYTELTNALEQAKMRNQVERMRLLEVELEKLKARLSIVKIVFQKGQPAKVTLDGTEIEPSRLDAPFAVDPGTHTFVFAAPSKRTQTMSVLVADGPQSQEVVVPLLDSEQTRTVLVPTTDPNAGNTQRILGWSFVGLGVAGVAVGGVFGLLASGHQSDADEKCPSGTRACSSREGVDANDSAHTSATISTVAFGVGIASSIAGVTLLLTAPKSTQAVRASPRANGFVIEGTF